MGLNASGGRHGLSYVAEAAYGVTPGPSPAPAMKRFRCGNCTLGLQKGELVPAESREDGQIATSEQGNHRGPGNIDFEWCYKAQDDLIAAIMRGAWDDDVLAVGTLSPSFTMERRFPDIGKYLRFPGALCDTLNISISQSQDGLFVTGSLSVLARTMAGYAASLGDPADVATGDPFGTFRGSVSADGDPLAILTGLTLTMGNGYALQPIIGSALSSDPSRQRFTITGSGTFLFQNLDMLDKFVTEQECALAVTLADAAGNEVEIDMPRIKYSGGDVPRSDEGPIVLTMPFRPLRDEAAGSPIVLTRHDAA